MGCSHNSIAAVVLVALCLQATAYSLTMEYVRHVKNDDNVKSVLIFFSEAIKLFASMLFSIRKSSEDGRSATGHLKAVFRYSLPLLVPAGIYFAQNILSFLVLNHLNASTFTALNQLKVLATGLFSVILLRKSLGWTKWRALSLLCIGAMLIHTSKQIVFKDDSTEGGLNFVPSSQSQSSQLPPEPVSRTVECQAWPEDLPNVDDTSLSAVELNVYGESHPYTDATGLNSVSPDMGDDDTSTIKNLGKPTKDDLSAPEVSIRQSEHEASHGKQNFTLGVVLVVVMAVLSGFSGVYFEKVLKSDENPHEFDVWDRNVQLALYSLIFTTLGLYMDAELIGAKGFFADFNGRTVGIIVLMSGGGLLTAMTVAYTSSVVKGFATSGAIVLTTILDHLLFEEPINSVFALGAACVILSIFNYSGAPPPGDTSSSRPSGDKNGAYAKVDTAADDLELEEDVTESVTGGGAEPPSPGRSQINGDVDLTNLSRG